VTATLDAYWSEEPNDDRPGPLPRIWYWQRRAQRIDPKLSPQVLADALCSKLASDPAYWLAPLLPGEEAEQ
jgi:hypothetical protein